MASQVVLRTGGRLHEGWKRLRVIRSLEQGAHSFELTVTDRWATNGRPRDVRAGDACQIYLDGALVLSGHIDDVLPDYDASNFTLTVRGRSALGDFIDCSLVGRDFSGQTLDAAARALAQPFGLTVTAAANVGAPFDDWALDPGEKPWEFLESAARQRGVLMISDESGGIVLTRAGTDRAAAELVLGKNVLRASGEFSTRDRYSEYLVMAEDAADGGAQDDVQAAKVLDTGITRYRPLVIVGDSPDSVANCRQRGEWERNSRWGRSRGIVYTVAGWRERPGGKIWTPNRMIRVRDRFMGIDEERLIVEVQLSLSDDGELAELRVMPREAFELQAFPPEGTQ